MSIYEFEVSDIQFNKISMSKFENKVLLVVNTASRCGFTPQYEELEQLYSQYKDQGLEILAFPCNQFGKQEPENEEAIQEFCNLNYKTSFPLFAKIDVNGPEASPLFEFLKESAPGILGSKSIKWNFTKFLIDRNGKVVKRFAPNDKPMDFKEEIEKLI